jgi:hypothetical protein
MTNRTSVLRRVVIPWLTDLLVVWALLGSVVLVVVLAASVAGR